MVSYNICFSEIECKEPDTTEDLIYKVRSYKIGGIVEYQCGKGYILQGNSNRVCLKKGSWNDTIPSCKGNKSINKIKRTVT